VFCPGIQGHGPDAGAELDPVQRPGGQGEEGVGDLAGESVGEEGAAVGEAGLLGEQQHLGSRFHLEDPFGRGQASRARPPTTWRMALPLPGSVPCGRERSLSRVGQGRAKATTRPAVSQRGARNGQ